MSLRTFVCKNCGTEFIIDSEYGLDICPECDEAEFNQYISMKERESKVGVKGK